MSFGKDPTTPHPEPEINTPTAMSSPDTPLETPAGPAASEREHAGCGEAIAKAGGRYRDALRAQDEEHEDDDDVGLPAVETVDGFMARLCVLEREDDGTLESTRAARDEMRRMLATVLPPLQTTGPLLMLQLETQRETIASLQQSIKVSNQMARLERDRHVAEKRAWQAETRALVRRGSSAAQSGPSRSTSVAEGSMVNGKLELRVGYHQELEAANKRLEMDNRLMAPRLADTQQQIESLVNELRHLRPHVVFSEPSAPSSRSPKKSPRHHHTMGDARTEHLLLAAHRFRKLREADPTVGLVTMDELKAHKVVGPQGGVGYAEGYGGEDDVEDRLEHDQISTSRRPSASEKAKAGRGKQSRNASGSHPLLPQTPRQRGKASTSTSTPRPTLHATPGGGGFGDLLLAASMATRPTTPERSRASTVMAPAMSASRSTSGRGDGYDVESSPSKRRRVVTGPSNVTWTPGQDDESDGVELGVNYDTSPLQGHGEHSALDILAQASALSNPPMSSSARFGGLMGSGSGSIDDDDDAQSPGNASHHSALGPAISLRASPPSNHLQSSSSEFRVPDTPSQQRVVASSMPTPNATPRPRVSSKSLPKKTPAGKTKVKGEPVQQPTPILTPDGGFASPAGGTVPGLGKYVHLTSKMPVRRERSPYLKWTVEEDELLARAVAQHGEKWDLVSKGVPTRSYHQVRQRWLRKNGAFDKKPPPASSLGLQQVSAMSDETDDEDGTPTPSSAKK